MRRRAACRCRAWPPCPGGELQHGSADRPSQAGDREAAAGALRQPLGAQGAAAGADGAAAGRPGGGATEDELAAEKAAARTQTVQSFERKRPSRKPFPAHLPRERVVIAAPESCPCCGSAKLSKLGEDITETLEVIPRRWKVIQTVREKFSCRECETITQPPAPFHVTPRGFAGPNLLAMILFEKFGQHQPLNRQSERYRREGIDLSVSTLADQVGACTAALQPLHALIEAHVLAAERLHGDDTTVPILAKGKTVTGHIWTYVRDDRPFGGPRRRRRSTTPRAIAGMSIPSGICRLHRHPAGRRL